MPLRFSPGGCCCGHDCTACCSDTLSDSVIVDLTDLDWGVGECPTCPDLAAEYHLTREAASNPGLEPPCAWHSTRDTDCLIYLGPTPHTKFETFNIDLSFADNGDGTCTLTCHAYFTTALNDLETAPNGVSEAFYSEAIETGGECGGDHTLDLDFSTVQSTYTECSPMDWPATITVTI